MYHQVVSNLYQGFQGVEYVSANEFPWLSADGSLGWYGIHYTSGSQKQYIKLHLVHRQQAANYQWDVMQNC